MLEFDDPNTVELKSMKHELKVSERAAAVQAGDIARLVRIDAREEERRKWKAYHRSIRKAPIKISKANKGRESCHIISRWLLIYFDYYVVTIEHWF